MYRGTAFSYTQFFNNGIIESVDTNLLTPRVAKSIPSKAFEEDISTAFETFLSLYKSIGVSLPVWVCITLLNVREYWMWYDTLFSGDENVIDRDELIVPEVYLDSFDTSGIQVLKPCFASVWNACGYEKSLNYDADGNWII